MKGGCLARGPHRYRLSDDTQAADVRPPRDNAMKGCWAKPWLRTLISHTGALVQILAAQIMVHIPHPVPVPVKAVTHDWNAWTDPCGRPWLLQLFGKWTSRWGETHQQLSFLLLSSPPLLLLATSRWKTISFCVTLMCVCVPIYNSDFQTK